MLIKAERLVGLPVGFETPNIGQNSITPACVDTRTALSWYDRLVRNSTLSTGGGVSFSLRRQSSIRL